MTGVRLAPHSPHPAHVTSKAEYLSSVPTYGSTIRLWSLSLCRLLRKAVLDCPARCIAWSPDGKLLVVGLGGSSAGTRQKKDGAVSSTNPVAAQEAVKELMGLLCGSSWC
jgi:WD40 repeat protein